MAREPYPDRELLTAKEVMHMLSMERTAFYAFLKEDSGFPRPVVIGRTAKADRRRWKKWQVLAYIDLLGPEERPIPRPKPS